MLDRREFLAGSSFLALLALLPLSWARASSSHISATQAHAKASSGEILLLDIRTPEEWKRTGIGAPAQALDMKDSRFLEKLAALTGGNTGKPIALICAVGGRSAYLQRVLARAGYSNVVDVAEGMLGSREGPGWIRSGLPLKPYTE